VIGVTVPHEHLCTAHHGPAPRVAWTTWSTSWMTISWAPGQQGRGSAHGPTPTPAPARGPSRRSS